MSLFDKMEPNCDRNAKNLSAAKGYKTFAKAWNFHVSNLFTRKLAGTTSVVVINRKSTVQLQQHYDKRKHHKELQNLMNKSDPLMQHLKKDLRKTRKRHRPSHNHGNVSTCAMQPSIWQSTIWCPLCFECWHSSKCAPSQCATNCFWLQTAKPNASQKNFKRHPNQIIAASLKKEHLQARRPFGTDCTAKCGHKKCSKCCCRITFDHHKNGWIGPHGVVHPHPTQSECSKWGMDDYEAQPQQFGTM